MICWRRRKIISSNLSFVVSRARRFDGKMIFMNKNVMSKTRPFLGDLFQWYRFDLVFSVTNFAQCGNFIFMYVTQILREINFEDFRSSNTAIVKIYQGSEFWFLVIFCYFWGLKYYKNWNSKPLKHQKWQTFNFYNPQNYFFSQFGSFQFFS